MAGHPAGAQLVNQVGPGRLYGGGTPTHEMFLDTDRGSLGREPGQQPRHRGRLRHRPGSGGDRGPHCPPAVPERVPVTVPWAWSRFNCRFRSIDPLGPLTFAPIVEPSSAVTVPVSGPQVTWLEDMATPPLTESPVSVTTRGEAGDPVAVMVKTTEIWPC